MFSIESPDFKEGGRIPRRYTCDGENLSPPLTWKKPPAGTKSFVLVLEDPDAPMGTFVHWVVFDVPPDMAEIYKGAGNNGTGLDNGMKHGMTDFGQVGYGGPCPPKGHGMHRYSFILKAIDLPSLGLDEGAKKSELERALKGHVLAETRITAVYQR